MRTVPVDRLLQRLQAEQDRRQRLSRLVMQLSCETAPLQLLGVDDAPQRVARDALRQVDGEGRSGREGLREAEVVVGETCVRAELVVRRDQADRSRPCDERDPEPAARAEPPNDVAVDLGVVENGVASLAPSALENPAALRRRARHRATEKLVLLACIARDGDGGEAQLGYTGREENCDEPGI